MNTDTTVKLTDKEATVYQALKKNVEDEKYGTVYLPNVEGSCGFRGKEFSAILSNLKRKKLYNHADHEYKGLFGYVK
jgi:hypothetical protein